MIRPAGGLILVGPNSLWELVVNKDAKVVVGSNGNALVELESKTIEDGKVEDKREEEDSRVEIVELVVSVNDIAIFLWK